MDGNNLQSPALQVPLLNKALDLTLSQYALQDRTFVLSPLPHVLLQDDHSPHEICLNRPARPEECLLPCANVSTPAIPYVVLPSLNKITSLMGNLPIEHSKAV